MTLWTAPFYHCCKLRRTRTSQMGRDAGGCRELTFAPKAIRPLGHPYFLKVLQLKELTATDWSQRQEGKNSECRKDMIRKGIAA
jgi:hypothetical protein